MYMYMCVCMIIYMIVDISRRRLKIIILLHGVEIVQHPRWQGGQGSELDTMQKTFALEDKAPAHSRGVSLLRSLPVRQNC